MRNIDPFMALPAGISELFASGASSHAVARHLAIQIPPSRYSGERDNVFRMRCKQKATNRRRNKAARIARRINRRRAA